MTFDSLHFFFFFILVFTVVRLLRNRVGPRNAFLLGASYYFYGCWDWRFLSLILFSTVVDYSCGLALDVSPANVGREVLKDRRRKLILLISLVANLGLLAAFKYFNFFIDSAAVVLESMGFQAHTTTLRIVLPVGISFYTFQTLSYTIDLYRGKIETERNLLTFGLYVAFFPQLVAGPIERAKHLLPQMRVVRPVTRTHFNSGIYLIFWGLIKKTVIADNVAGFADAVFATPADSGLFALLGVYAFAIQIYCDFSGYSDIARGTARCLGFDLMLNFNLPYFATNPGEFWRRWHISLSSWLRDYLYISMGGNRVNAWRNYLNLMVTMILGGLWHGAAWIFVIWGFYHGLLLCLHRVLEPLLKRLRPATGTLMASLWRGLMIFCFFHLTCIGWLIFRARSVGQIGEFLTAMVTRFPGPIPGWANFEYLATLASCGVFLFGYQLLQYRSRDLNMIHHLPVPVRALVYAVGFSAIILFGRIHGSAFIYFQF